jgi:hypothetical protein
MGHILSKTDEPLGDLGDFGLQLKIAAHTYETTPNELGEFIFRVETRTSGGNGGAPLHFPGGTMRNHSYSVLKSYLVAVVLAAALLTVPAVVSQQSGEYGSFFRIKSGVDVAGIVSRYGRDVDRCDPRVEQVPVRGSSTNLANIRKDPNVLNTEYDLAVEISEGVMLNGINSRLA